MNEIEGTRTGAIRRFEQARRRAKLEQMSARFTRRDTRMLPFDAIRSELRQQNPLYMGVQEIPLDAIVGSVGRYKEFTRKFLPLSNSLRERWIGIENLTARTGWPPIETYRVGNVFFVKDGNHRVSVARQMELPTIEAHVWAYPSELQINPEDDLNAIFIQLGRQSFMEKTHLDELAPDHGIVFTSPGRYTELLVQIHGLRQTLAEIDGQVMPFDESVAAWYEMIYLPTIHIIKESPLLEDFPGRTEADLFVWLSQQRTRVQAVYGHYDNLADLAHCLAEDYKMGGLGRLTRQMRRLFGSDELPSLEVPVEDVRTGNQ